MTPPTITRARVDAASEILLGMAARGMTLPFHDLVIATAIVCRGLLGEEHPFSEQSLAGMVTWATDALGKLSSRQTTYAARVLLEGLILLAASRMAPKGLPC